jgi:hypothetical protein
VRLGHLLGGRHDSGADSPDRLVRDEERRPCGRAVQRARELARDDALRLLPLPLRERFADAEERREPGAPRGAQLGARHGVTLTEEPPPLGVADEHVLGAGVAELLGRDLAGERPLRLRVAALTAERGPGLAPRFASVASAVAGGKTRNVRSG